MKKETESVVTYWSTQWGYEKGADKLVKKLKKAGLHPRKDSDNLAVYLPYKEMVKSSEVMQKWIFKNPPVEKIGDLYENEEGKTFLKRNPKKTFHRLPGHVIGNELYNLKQLFESIYSTQTHGDDFDMKRFNYFITLAKKIKSEAKLFKVGEDVPVSYRYKNK